MTTTRHPAPEMTPEEGEKKIIAAFNKAGYAQTRIKSDDLGVHVVGLGATAVSVVIPNAKLSEQAIKDAVEAALAKVPKPVEATPEVTPEAPAAKIGTPPKAPVAEDDDDDDDPAKPAPKGGGYKPIGKK